MAGRPHIHEFAGFGGRGAEIDGATDHLGREGSPTIGD
jgi:hypothetical protein